MAEKKTNTPPKGTGPKGTGKTTAKKAAVKKTANKTTAKKTTAKKAAPKTTKKPIVKKAAPKVTAKKSTAKKATPKTAKKPATKKSAPKPPKKTIAGAAKKEAAKKQTTQEQEFNNQGRESTEEMNWKANILSSDIFEKLKKGLDEAYDAGNKLADKIGDTAREYGERYKLQMEVRRVKSHRKEHLLEIGEMVYEMFPTLGKSTKVASDENISNLFTHIQDLEKQLKKLDSQLKEMS